MKKILFVLSAMAAANLCAEAEKFSGSAAAPAYDTLFIAFNRGVKTVTTNCAKKLLDENAARSGK